MLIFLFSCSIACLHCQLYIKKQRLVALPFQSGIQPSLRSVVAASQHHGLWGLVFAHGIPVEFMSTSSTRWRDFVTCSTVSRHRTMQTDCMRWTRLLADGSPKGCPQILINRFVLHMLWRFGNKFRQTHVVYVTIIIIRVAVYPKLTSNHEVIQLFSLELPISQVKHRHIQTSTFLQIQGNIQAVRSTRNPLCSLTSRFLQRSPERKSRRWWSAMAEWFLNIRITKVGLFALVPICALPALPHRWRCQTLPYNF